MVESQTLGETKKVITNSNSESSSNYVKSPEKLLNVDAKPSGLELKKTLGFGVIFLIALNFIFDSSILYVPQYSVYHAGTASLISWVIITFIAIYVAMCYAELISMFPTSGGIYEVSKVAFGTFISFLIGWTSWLVGNVGLAISMPEGLQVLVPFYSPLAYVFKAILCFITLYFFCELAKKGKDMGSKIVFYMTIVILLVFSIIIVPMLIDFPALTEEGKLQTSIKSHLYLPLLPSDNPLTTFALVIGTLFIVSTYLAGLDGVSYLAGEIKDPKRTIPKVYIRAMIVVAVISLIIAFVSLGVIDRDPYINSENYFHDILLETLGDYTPMIAHVILILAGFIYFSEGFAWMLSSPRLIFSIAKDKLFPTKYAQLDKETNTPTNAINFQRATIIIFIIITFLLYNFSDSYLGELDVFYFLLSIFLVLTIILISIALIAIPVLRKKLPDIERPYKVPFGTWLPYVLVIIFVVSAILWVIYEETGVIIFYITIGLILLGIPIYALLVIYFDPDVYIKLRKVIGKLSSFYEPILLSEGIKKKMYAHLENIKNKRILQYGCSSHKFTLELAEKVTPNGKVYVADLVDKTIEQINYHIKKRNINHVHTFHDVHQANRVHPFIPKVDAIISTGMLGHIQDLRKIAKEMSKLLPEGGKIIFKEEIDLLYIIPNIGWVALPDRVVEIFAEEGIRINYIYQPRLFWTDLIVYGIKTKYDVPMI